MASDSEHLTTDLVDDVSQSFSSPPSNTPLTNLSNSINPARPGFESHTSLPPRHFEASFPVHGTQFHETSYKSFPRDDANKAFKENTMATPSIERASSAGVAAQSKPTGCLFYALMNAKRAASFENGIAFKAERSIILEYLEPQYQRIKDAYEKVVELISREKGACGHLNADLEDFDDAHVLYRKLDFAARSIIFLEDFAETFGEMPLSKSSWRSRKRTSDSRRSTLLRRGKSL